MTETPETAETPEKPNNKALELARELVSIIQDGKLDDQAKVEKVKTFIEENKDNNLYLNVQGVADGRTVLHYAAEFGTPEMVKALVEAGAKENIPDNGGALPIHLATQNKKHPDVINQLNIDAYANARDSQQETPLFKAVRAGNLEAVNILLEAGAEVNAKNQDERTPLHIAAHYGRLEMLEALIKAGANVNATDNDQWTPLRDAAHFGTPETVQALIDASANVNATANSGLTVFKALEAKLEKTDLTDGDRKRLEQNRDLLRNAGNAGKGDKPQAGEPKDGKGDKDGEPQAGEPKDDKGDKPKGKPKPKGRGAPRTTGKPSGNATTERPPEAQGPTAGDTNPGGAPATQPAQEEKGGLGHWFRNSMFGRFFGLDDESVAKRAQTGAQLAQYGQEGGGWFRNSLLGRWLGLDDQTKLKELAQTQPAQPQNATVRAAYGGGHAAQAKPMGAAVRLGANAGGDLTQEPGQRKRTPGRGVSPGRER